MKINKAILCKDKFQFQLLIKTGNLVQTRYYFKARNLKINDQKKMKKVMENMMMKMSMEKMMMMVMMMMMMVVVEMRMSMVKKKMKEALQNIIK